MIILVCFLLLCYCMMLSRRISGQPKPTLFQRLDGDCPSGHRAPVDPSGKPYSEKAVPWTHCSQYLNQNWR